MPGELTASAIELVAERPDGQRLVCSLETASSVLVGKSSSCGLQLAGAAVSPLHCLISFEEGALWVQDWQSAGGTFVNGQRTDGRTRVAAGDEITIGEYRLRHGSRSQERSGATRLAVPAVENKLPDIESPELLSEREAAPEWCTGAYDRDDAAPAGEHSGCGDSGDRPSEESLPRSAADGDADGAPEICVSCASDEPAGDGEWGVPSLDSLLPSVDDPVRLDPALFEAETYDAETVALLKAEIDHLQAAVAERDARLSELQNGGSPALRPTAAGDELVDSATLVARLDDLLAEAARSDERVRVLEEMLQVSEEANHAEQEERRQLEAWLADIEQRIGQREAEQHAEVESLRRRFEQASDERDRAERHLHQAVAAGQTSERVEQAVEQLRQQLIAQRQQNAELQQQLESLRTERDALIQRLDQSESQEDRVLREERAAIAQERAKVSRLRFELSRELAALEEMPKQMNAEDREVAGRLQTLREHLREIHQQEQEAQRQQRESSLTHRVARLWKRVDQ